MVNKIQLFRSNTHGNRPAIGGEPWGFPYVNFADKQLGVVDSTLTPQDLIGVPFFSIATNYNPGQPVNYQGQLYGALSTVVAGPWNSAQWSLFGTQSWIQNWVAGAYLPLTGGTLTGSLAINPSTGSSVINCVTPSGSNAGALLFYRQNLSHARWAIYMTSEAETGNQAGSNFWISNYNDVGSGIGTPFAIQRSSGTVALGLYNDGNYQTNIGPCQITSAVNTAYGFSTFGARPTSGGGSYAFQFWNSGFASAGNIVIYDNGVGFNTASDVRMKDNIKPFMNGRGILDRLQIRDFIWKFGGRRGIGIIAQEAREVYPDAISGTEREEDHQPLGVDYSKYVPLLIEALQAAHKRIDALEALVKTLKK